MKQVGLISLERGYERGRKETKGDRKEEMKTVRENKK